MKKDLTEVKEGEEVKVVEILGGLGFKRRLESMGIVPNVIIKKV